MKSHMRDIPGVSVKSNLHYVFCTNCKWVLHITQLWRATTKKMCFHWPQCTFSKAPAESNVSLYCNVLEGREMHSEQNAMISMEYSHNKLSKTIYPPPPLPSHLNLPTNDDIIKVFKMLLKQRNSLPDVLRRTL